MVFDKVYGQMAVVVSSDGYANVRVGPSLASDTLTTLVANTVVLIDGVFLDSAPDGKWRKVYFSQDQYCFGCSPDRQETYQSGYVHLSQLKNVADLKQVESSVFSMSFNVQEFKAAGKRIEYGEDSTIISINGHAYFGMDCGMPQTETIKVSAILGDKKFTLPLEFVWSIVHAQNNFRYFSNGSNYFALQRIGDGACSTEAVWRFDRSGLKQRLIGWSY